MPQLENVYAQIAELDPLEREELMVRLKQLQEAQQAFPLIVSTPDVCGGEPRIIRTRIPVWTIERMRQLGASQAEILRNFPTLRAADIVQAWSYAELHRSAIEQAIRENEED